MLKSRVLGPLCSLRDTPVIGILILIYFCFCLIYACDGVGLGLEDNVFRVYNERWVCPNYS